MISLEQLERIRPDNTFIVISKTAAAALYTFPGMRPTAPFPELRRVIIASFWDSYSVLAHTARCYVQPEPQAPPYTGSILARFQMTLDFHNKTMDCSGLFHCSLVSGSPNAEKSQTLLLMNAELIPY
jgi:hypothetical protein